MRRATCAVVLALMCGLTACGSSTGGARPPAGGGSSAPSGPHALLATDAANGHTVIAHVGDVVRVRLSSTYWRFDPPAGTALRISGTPSFHPDASCVPGGGCGTVAQTYRAVRTGTVRIGASRTTCGEALRCMPNQSRFSVTVVVRG